MPVTWWLLINVVLGFHPWAWAMEENKIGEGVYPSELTASVVNVTNSATAAAFADIVKISKTEKILFVQALVKEKKSYEWPPHIKRAYKRGLITSEDLWWIIEQNDYLKINTREQDKSLFRLAIMDQIEKYNPSTSNDIMSLLTTPVFKNPNSYLGDYFGWIQNEVSSVLSKLVESADKKENFEMLKEILEKAPTSLIKLNNIHVREEAANEKTGGMISPYKYFKRFYTLAYWIAREDYNYLDKRKKQKPHFVEIARLLVERCKEEYVQSAQITALKEFL
jgi:hypothetical protein